jgi:hypothetical protein
MTAFWDFMPTAAELAGISSPEGIDGISIVDELVGKPNPKEHEFLFWSGNNAVRTKNWKYINGELYDINNDIKESNNVAAQHPDVIAKMEAIVEQAKKKTTLTWDPHPVAGIRQKHSRISVSARKHQRKKLSIASFRKDAKQKGYELNGRLLPLRSAKKTRIELR